MAQQNETSSRRSDIDLPTLLITAAASAAAAFVCSKIWTPGTLPSAAFTPVVVALIREALRRPTERVTSAVTVPLPRRRGEAAPGAPTTAPTRRYETIPEDLPERLEHGAPPVHPPPVPGVETPIKVYTSRSRRLHWRIALITGVLGFVIAAVAFTVPELLAGRSLSGDNGTTLFQGKPRHHTTTTVKTTTTTTTPTTPAVTTVTKTVTSPTTSTAATTPGATTAVPTTPTTPTTTPTTPPNAGATPTPAAP